jgi:hypothetical protein
MGNLIAAHDFEHRATTSIGLRQALQMTIDVPFDLFLGFADEAEADAITGDGGGCTDGEGARIPERSE